MNKRAKKKLYILDTNVLIHDPEALYAFEGAYIGIPITVLEELDHFKGENTQRSRNAREAIRHLDYIRQQGCISDGIAIANGSTVKVLLKPEREVKDFSLDLSVQDNQILEIAVAAKEQGYDVRFISKDLNMRVKADALRLEADDYLRHVTPETGFYYGWRRAEVPAVELTRDRPAVLDELAAEKEFTYNEFILLESRHNPENYRIFRYIGADTYKPVVEPDLRWPFRPRNPQQLMALDLLLDDSVQLVSLVGPAGTGKTFMTLIAALYKILIAEEYEKLLVTRPIIPLGKDIGYLPGDIQEKLHSWMQPVRDNMEYIVYRANAQYEMGLYQEPEERMRPRDKKKKPRKRHSGGALPSLDQLIDAGKVSLEAITYMRGRSIPYQFIVIDEVQNLTPHEVKTLISRVGEGSKIILAGDPYQIDSPYLDLHSNGLVVASQRFQGQILFGSVYLQVSERSQLSQLASELL